MSANRAATLRVAYISFAPFVSGAERSLQTLIANAPVAAIEPVVICPPGSAMIEWCGHHGVACRAVTLADRDKWHALRWFRSVRAVRRMLLDEAIDVLHSNQVWSYAAAGAAAGPIRIPRVCHMRDEVPVEAVRWWCQSGVEGVICISRFVEELVTPAWAGASRPPRIVTMLNPIGAARHSDGEDADRAARIEFRRRHRLPTSAFTLGFVGQIAPVKGLLELADALAGLETGGWHLVIAGRDPHGGTHQSALRDQLRVLGLDSQVTFVGFLEDLDEFYRSIDVLVVPSRAEPLGRVPLEAAAHGTPAIAFAVGGLPETIIDGVTGRLVPAGDVPALRAALRAAMANSEAVRQLGAAARDWVRAHCDPGLYAQRLRTFYDEIHQLAGR